MSSIDTNINPYYNGSIDTNKDFYAFVDESGDEGFDFSKEGASKWFNVSGIIMKPTISNLMVKHIIDYRNDKLPTRPLEKMSAKDLKHGQRKDIFNGLATFDFSTTHSLFYKPKIDPRDRLLTYPSMYFVGIKNVLERITWCAQQYNRRKVHVILSGRNAILKHDLKIYLFKNSLIANKNHIYLNTLGIVKVSNFSQRPQLLLADYVAFSLRKAVEKEGTPPTSEPYYCEMLQKGKFYNSNHPKWGGVWGNGLKCTPRDKTLIEHSGILNEGSHKF